jgi:glucuronoarabinoxylan endo-1,4-beta-xylanase
MLFSTNAGIGLSLLRNQVQAGGFASSAEIGIMQQAIERGARVWSAPWSPQASFKTPQIANGGNFDSANNQAYADQLASYVRTMKNQGIDVYALSVQNEPDITNSTYATCWWTAQQISNFVPYLHDALVASNVDSTRIMISESFQWQNHTALYTTAMDDPNIAAMVGVIADHNYDGIPPDPPTGTPSAIANYGKSLWETEVAVLDPSGSSDSSMQNGIYWAGRIHAFLTVAQVNAWHYWWLIYGNSTPNQGLTDISTSVLAKRGYVLGNYSRFVRPNFYRMGVVTNSGAAMVSAFQATNSSAFAIVAINSNQTNSINQTFNLSNFTANSVIPWVTTSALSLSSEVAVAITNSAFFYQLPPLSVVTFVGQASPPRLTGTRQGESLVLSWPTNASGFGLEYSMSVAGGSWVPYPATPTVLGSNFVVTSGLSNDASFFRLRIP